MLYSIFGPGGAPFRQDARDFWCLTDISLVLPYPFGTKSSHVLRPQSGYTIAKQFREPTQPRLLVRAIFLSFGLCFQEARAAATPLCMLAGAALPLTSCQVVVLNSGAKGSLSTCLDLRRGILCIITSSRRMGSLLCLPPCTREQLRCLDFLAQFQIGKTLGN